MKWFFKRKYGTWVWQITGKGFNEGSCGRNIFIEAIQFIYSLINYYRHEQ